MKKITHSEFDDIINTQFIPPVFKDYITVQQPKHRIEFLFKNIEIVRGDRGYLYIENCNISSELRI